jgi:hypothetical protein
MSFYSPLLISLFNDLEADPPVYEDFVGAAMAKINENFAAIDGAINTALNGLDPQNSVATKSLSAAPTTGLAVGARYIVAATPAGGDPWEGHTTHIAELTATTPAYAWEFITPNKGFNLTVEDENLEYIYTGAAWASRPSVELHNSLGSLQGGSENERYHVSAAVSTGLAAGYLPASNEKAALAGTQGTPGDGNRFVTTTDVRLTNVVVQTDTITAGEALTQYQMLYCNSQDAGKYYKATTAGTPEALDVVAVCYAASIAQGSTGLVIINPTLITNPAWAMTQGRAQWLGTDGEITEQKPAANAVYLGYAASPTSLFFNPGRPADEIILDINADLLEMNYVAQSYTPTLTPGVNATDQLGAHIAGLDGALTVPRSPANHNLVDTTKHPVSGLTTGHVLKATGAAAYGFGALSTADVADSADKRYCTDAQKTVIGNTSGTNSGNETTTTIGALINSATAKTAPVDADYLGLMDSESTNPANILKKLSWSYVKSVLKTYFDGLYTLANLGGIATSTKGAASGVASLNAATKVVEDPANATATPTASKIPIADGSGKLAAGWGGSALTLATLNANSLVVENPANAAVDAAPGKIPIADANGSVDNYVVPIVVDVNTDMMELNFIPDHYTPALTPSCVSTTQLAAFLKGLDNTIAALDARITVLE